MASSFFFYDLETSGINPRDARIMQFAGQRTDMQLKPIGKPFNILVRLTDDILPEPDAILITGITPQATLADGINEAEFLHIFQTEIATPDTIFVGFNSVRFDDEFMRFTLYRNFYDAYEWQWKDGRSRWDMLDVVRMTRALRPEDIKWPVDSEGKATNRLELLTKLNKLDHTDAHDALSDVYATIEVAKLIRSKQTKLFDYLCDMRTKQKVAELVQSQEPFVYTSGKYPGEFEKTTVAVHLVDNLSKQGVLVYDLRHNPDQFKDKTPAELVELWRYNRDKPDALRLPVKTLQFNRCPAVAPLGVLDDASKERIKLDLNEVQTNLKKLRASKDFVPNVLEALEIMNKEQQTHFLSNEQDVDNQLYDGFLAPQDKPVMSAVRGAEPSDVNDFADKLHDPRLKTLLPLYKARNFPKALTSDERIEWEKFRTARLTAGGNQSRVAKFINRLSELSSKKHLSEEKRYLLQELQLYAESIMPADQDYLE
jgi:exodeoxyribonuclease-1